jgi:hypothetical protein
MPTAVSNKNLGNDKGFMLAPAPQAESRAPHFMIKVGNDKNSRWW